MQSSPLPDTFFSGPDLAVDPIERSETIPSTWYTDPRLHDFEREAVFGSAWQYAGPVPRLKNPGDYLLAEAAGNPIILVLGKDRQLRAFYNVCRHRGGPLATEPEGSCDALQCKYHGWTYMFDGSLRGVPHFDRVDLFDKKDFGLVPVEFDVWENLLFLNLRRIASAPPLGKLMSGIAERIVPHRLSDLKFHTRVTYDVKCNWKVYVDNYLEGYHLPFVHPELCNLLDFRNYKTETFQHYSLQYSPFTGAKNVYSASEGEAYYYFVFPNFMLNILPGRLQTNLVVPLTHATCRVIFDYYYPDPASPETASLAKADMEYSDKVQAEDIEICERVQTGLESFAYHRGRFSVDMEAGVHHFQSLLKQSYRAAL